MAYSETLAARIRAQLAGERGYSERRMFGGLCVMLRGRMCAGVLGEDLIVRVAPGDYAAALTRPYTARFEFTGRPMRGFVVVRPKGCPTAARLARWLALGTRMARATAGKPAARQRATRSRAASLSAARRPRRPSRAR